MRLDRTHTALQRGVTMRTTCVLYRVLKLIVLRCVPRHWGDLSALHQAENTAHPRIPEEEAVKLPPRVDQVLSAAIFLR